jgi:transposase
MAELPIVPSDLSTLDRGLLEALVIAQQEQMLAKDEAIAAHHEKLISRDNEIEHLKLVIAKLRRMIFGTKSEKVTREIEQLELKLEELETGKAERVLAATKTDASPRNKPTRRPLPAHLPREVHTHLPTGEACPDCGGELRRLGEDISGILERIPPSYKVIQHVRLKMACTKCDVIVQAPAPSRPIERGLAGPALLAHVLVSKYADHCPLYRQSEIFARDGIDLDRSTLADWVGGASHLLSPLIDQIQRHPSVPSRVPSNSPSRPLPSKGRTLAAVNTPGGNAVSLLFTVADFCECPSSVRCRAKKSRGPDFPFSAPTGREAPIRSNCAPGKRSHIFKIFEWLMTRNTKADHPARKIIAPKQSRKELRFPA